MTKIDEATKRVADKYIPRKDQGTLPGIEPPPPTGDRLNALAVLTVLSFILWHKKTDMFGGHKAQAAFDALMLGILKMPPHMAERFRQIVASTEWEK